MSIDNLKYGKSFWFYYPDKGFPPKLITNFDDYNGDDKLSLSITQLNVSSKEQNKIINQWCEIIPKITGLKYIWFHSKVSQKIFDSVCANPDIEGLYIKRSGIKDLSILSNLKNLKYFWLGSSSQITDLSVLRKIKDLEVLDIENTNQITDYSLIGDLTNLKELALTGSMWTSLKIDSFEPLTHLKKLNYLNLGNTKVNDKNIRPLGELKDLVSLYLPLWYKRDDYKYLYSMLPNLKYGEIEKIATDDKYCKEYKIK